MWSKLSEYKYLQTAVLLLFCTALLSPSYVINNIDSHDWGGDFSMYIKQAETIVSGTPQTENNYIFNPENAVLGPKTYPVGFPLLLAPVIAYAGNDMALLIDFMAILAVLFGVVIFVLLKSRTNAALALLVAFGICYHTVFLFFKREVMADIPFALFCLLSIYAINQKKWWLAMPMMLLAVLTKTAGITLLLSAGFLLFFNLWRSHQNNFRTLLKQPLLWLIVFATIGNFILSNLVFQTDTSSGYVSNWESTDYLAVIDKNAEAYWDFSRWFFFDSIFEKPVGVFAVGLWLILAAIGLIKSSFRKLGMMETWTFVYIGMLLFYPYSNAGIRFVLPLIPIVFIYVAEALMLIRPKRKVLVSLLAIIPFFFAAERSYNLANNWPKSVDGPQSENAVALFNFVKENTDKNTTFLFTKPRVLGLYANRNAIGNGKRQSQESILTQLDSIPINYLVQAYALPNAGLDSVLSEHKSRTNLVYNVDGFRVYEWE